MDATPAVHPESSASGLTRSGRGASASRKKLRICPTCDGHRIEKVLYNHMMLDRTCSLCDGEGVLVCPENHVEVTRVSHANSVRSA